MTGNDGTLVKGLGKAAHAARSAGLGRIVDAARDAADAALCRGGRPPLAVETDGFRLSGFLRHRSHLESVARGYPGGYRTLFASTVEPGSTVCDGGAHIGLYTLIAARRSGPKGHVLAFEPDGYNLRALRWNVAHAHADNVVTIPKALAEGEGSAVFYENATTISSSLTDRPRHGSATPRRVELTSLDAELDPTPLDLLVVKLNVEGAEPRALAGMAQSLERAAGVRLFVEVNPPALAQAGTSVGVLLRDLRAQGLTLSLIDQFDESLTPLRGGEFTQTRQLFAARG